MGLVFLAALAWRLRDVMLYPRLSDETAEVLLGLRIARGDVLPLTGVQPYIGALFSYVVAGTFLLLGPRMDVGRIVVAEAGALTVIPTFLLGRALGGPSWRGQAVGLIAAALLALSATHTLVTSRIAYSNSLTPLFVTTGFWLLQRALARQSGPALVASGLAFGLALQTHVASLALVPGLLAGLVLSGRALLFERADGRRVCPPNGSHRSSRRVSAWLPSRWVALAGLAGLLAVANLVVFNLATGFGSVAGAGLRSGRYLDDQGLAPDAWLGRFLALLRSLALALGSQVSEQIEPWAVWSPMVLGVGGLALLGLASFARRGWWLPLLVVTSELLIVSLLNSRVEPVVPRARHYAPLIPLGLVAAAEGLVALHRAATSWLERRAGCRRHVHGADTRPTTARSRIGRGAAHAGLLLAAVAILIGSVQSLRAYEVDRLGRPDKNNLALLAVLDAVAGSGRRNERVYLDVRLAELRTLSGGRTLNHLRYAFAVQEQANTIVNLAEGGIPFGPAPTEPRRLIVRAEEVELAGAAYRLVPLRGEPGPDAPLRAFRAYPRGQ